MKRHLTILALSLTMISSAQAVLLCESTDSGNDDVGVPSTTTSIPWYVGQPAPSLNVGPEQSVVCAANGAELAYIYGNFSNIPETRLTRGNYSKFVIWRGDAAVFIIDNL